MNGGRTQATFPPPVMEARRWLQGVDFKELPLLNVSQAAPVDPPPPPLVAAMARALTEADTHLYGPVLGLPDLRRQVAADWCVNYGGTVTPDHVGITSGCNQAFSAAISTLCDEGDQVILPTPFYFNHKMWLDMQGVMAVPLPCSGDMIPDVAQAAALITDKTRAISLVTPNNPCGVEYPKPVMEAFFDLCADHGIALIVDETYRDFHSEHGAPHSLFQRPDWDQTLIQLYSFSKAYRLTGHRVGAIVTSPNRMTGVEKFLDTVSVCPNQLGQKAALWGMRHLGPWLADERVEILNRRAAIEACFPKLADQGWALLGCGAYFAYVAHPFDMSSADLAPLLVQKASILTLPGTMFMPKGDQKGAKQLRIAFANINSDEIAELFDRLAQFTP
ncbi:MAG: aminotransferase [Pseudomonadota bacterium]